MVDLETYKLGETNYHQKSYNKTQIIIGHTYRKNMLHFASWVYRLNNKNKKTATFTINKDGKIYQHFDPKFYSDFVNKEQDKASISIVLENLGWLKRDGMIDRYNDWLGNSYKLEPSEILSKRWRNHQYWHTYTSKQMESLKNLVDKLCEEYNIPKEFIGHNTYDENIDLFKGITFRSNYYPEATDVSPAFDMSIF